MLFAAARRHRRRETPIIIPINQNESKSAEAFGVRVFRDSSYLDGLAPALL